MLDEIIKQIYGKSPLQKKKLSRYFKNQNQDYFNSFNRFLRDYNGYLESQDLNMNYAIDAYLKMCDDMVKCQIYFLKTGFYPIADAKQAYDKVYSNKNEMKSFMIGLALSQFLWATHYEMFSFFLQRLTEKKEDIHYYLDIGPGHGIFLKEAIQILDKNVVFTAVDISQTSIDITRSIIEYFLNERRKIEYFKIDMLDLDIQRKYDFITMGEVLEHVNCPKVLLKKIHSLLSENGIGFISTCVNCPTIDHVYHFTSINEIRKMIVDSKLSICSEKVLPVENLLMEEIIKRRITINYCAIVRREFKE